MMGVKQNVLNQLVSLLLGASVAGVFVFFLSSAGTGARSAGISSFANGTMAIPTPSQEANHANHTGSKVASHETNQTTPSLQGLEKLLRAAADEDRTVIMTSVNEAWAAPGSLLDTFLESFRVGENISHFVEHIIVVAMDEGALLRCHALKHPHCHLLLPDPENNSPNGTSPDLSGAKSYMTKDYLSLVWSKLRLQQRVLDLGHNLLFTDVDVAWFRDPRVHITLAADITTSSDFYFGDPDDLGNYPNTGFIYFKATARNGRAMAHWHAARSRFPREHDQFVFNEIKRELAAPGIGVRIRFIDSKDVSGFCQLGRDMNRVATVHTTCCIGLENKLHDLKRVVVDWKRYLARPVWERRAGLVGWTFQGGKCIH